MPVVIVCAGCQRKLQVPDNMGGRKVRCPSCGQTMVISLPPAAPAVKKISFTIHYQGQQAVVVLESSLDRSLAAILSSGLQQLKPPPAFVPAAWQITYQGK